MQDKTNIAVFVSSHGFGHAARISAVMASLHKLQPEIHFEILTQVPEWFFLDTLPAPVFNYHALKTDIGLIQTSPLQENISATLTVLADFIPFKQSVINSVSDQLKKHNCCMVLCDISPLGLAIARKADLPSVLIENFTWDWIYDGYTESRADFIPFSEYLKVEFACADYRIQTDPVCQVVKDATQVNPVARNPQKSPDETRKKLGIDAAAKTVLVTLGGVPSIHNYIQLLHQFSEIDFILPINVEKMKREKNCVILPHHSKFYHPDLVIASDAVIGKLGYSTLAEVYHAGIPFGFITRDSFRESIPLGDFVETNMPSIRFSQAEFTNGSWIESIPALLEIEWRSNKKINGAQQAAKFIIGRMEASGKA